MSNLKVVVIGGGSSYTPELIEGFLINHSEFPVTDITLVDIEDGVEKLDIIYNLGKRMIEKSGKKINFTKTLNRREALVGADFVVTQLRVGLIDARIVDEGIPKSMGFIGQETNGAGGLFKGLRTIPVIIDIANELAEIAPNAWLINFTNPASMVTEAVLKRSNHKRVVGLCNGPINMKTKVAKILGEKLDDIYVEFRGSNHMNFITKVTKKGEDLTKKTIDLLIKEEKDTLGFKNINNEKFNDGLIRATNTIPSSYLKYYLKPLELLKEQETKKKTRGEDVKDIEKRLFEIYKNPNLNEKPKELEDRGGALYSTAAVNVIKSIYLDDRSIQTVNVFNNGAIKGIDDDSVVEVNCVITKDGPKPIAVGKIPSPMGGLVSHMKDYEAMVVDAAVDGSYEKLLSAFIFNPLCISDNLGKVLIDKMLIANKRYLPQFSGKIKELEDEYKGI